MVLPCLESWSFAACKKFVFLREREREIIWAVYFIWFGMRVCWDLEKFASFVRKTREKKLFCDVFYLVKVTWRRRDFSSARGRGIWWANAAAISPLILATGNRVAKTSILLVEGVVIMWLASRNHLFSIKGGSWKLDGLCKKSLLWAISKHPSQLRCVLIIPKQI